MQKPVLVITSNILSHRVEPTRPKTIVELIGHFGVCFFGWRTVQVRSVHNIMLNPQFQVPNGEQDAFCFGSRSVPLLAEALIVSDVGQK